MGLKYQEVARYFFLHKQQKLDKNEYIGKKVQSSASDDVSPREDK
jgi:hypothetical protein